MGKYRAISGIFVITEAADSRNGNRFPPNRHFELNELKNNLGSGNKVGGSENCWYATPVFGRVSGGVAMVFR